MRKGRLAALLALCAVAVTVITQWPEIERYLNMRRM
jgi:hypothetical protein